MLCNIISWYGIVCMYGWMHACMYACMLCYVMLYYVMLCMYLCVWPLWWSPFRSSIRPGIGPSSQALASSGREERDPAGGVGAMAAGPQGSAHPGANGAVETVDTRGWWTGSKMKHMLVGGLVAIFGIFPYVGNNHPNWLSYFSEGFKPPTSMVWLVMVSWSDHSRWRPVLVLFTVFGLKSAIYLRDMGRWNIESKRYSNMADFLDK